MAADRYIDLVAVFLALGGGEVTQSAFLFAGKVLGLTDVSAEATCVETVGVPSLIDTVGEVLGAPAVNAHVFACKSMVLFLINKSGIRLV